MGQKNGRGIYRTKRTGEKFVGNWVLGLRQGKGAINGYKIHMSFIKICN